MKRWVTILPAMLLACAAQAQPQAPASPASGPKVAVTSLVGDTMYITARRDRTGTNMGNSITPLKMPGPLLDVMVLKAAQESLEKVLPGALIAALKVPAAGSAADPAQMVADGKAVAGNAVVDALRQQGFTHLVTATKYRALNSVRLSDGLIGTGQLEGLGFYIDPTIGVQRHGTVERAEGIIAPHLYVELRLVDLASLEVRSTRPITASSTVSAANNPTGTDAWGALTAEEKMNALQRLIRRHVGESAPALFQSK